MPISKEDTAKLIPTHVIDRWQGIVDTMAEMLDVPFAIIAEIEPPKYEIFRINATNPMNLMVGDKYTLSDIYCETVYNDRSKLVIPNALKDEKWCNHPEVDAGLISYLGFPIILPNNEIFGTICIIDVKENNYGEKVEKFISLFKDQIESHLALLVHEAELETVVEHRTNELSRSNEQLLFEIEERKKAYSMLKESEDRFRGLVENAPMGIGIDTSGKLVYCNPEHQRIIGPVPDGIGFPYQSNLYPEDAVTIEKLFNQFLAHETGNFDGIFRIYPFDGPKKTKNLKWIQCRAIHIKYGSDRAVIAALFDVTRAKQMEHLAQIEDKMSAIGRVTTGIAHEILSPLSSINMNMSTVKEICDAADGYDAETYHTIMDIVDQVQDASGRIKKIVKNVTDFARPSHGYHTMANLNQSVERALNLCRPMLREKKIDVETDLNPKLPLCRADAQMIEEVLVNLFSNAAQVMQAIKGRRLLSISSGAFENAVNIRIADSGPGIPDEIREKIFDPFFTTKKYGLGIGLTLAHRIVRDHGGDLNLGCSETGGAEFTIRIPSAAA